MKLKAVTSNRNKAVEIAAFFKGIAEIEHVPLECPEYRDDDVREISRMKAEYAFAEIGESLIVDDTAFCIDALDGFPGPYAAYVHDRIGNKGILKLMDGETDRGASFITAITLATNERFFIFTGVLEGEIAFSEKGEMGFGYDPIFLVGEKTLAELTTDEKNMISHRARALLSLREWLTGGEDKNH